jgi:hypothetical protein
MNSASGMNILLLYGSRFGTKCCFSDSSNVHFEMLRNLFQ